MSVRKWSTEWLNSRTDEQLEGALGFAEGNAAICADGNISRVGRVNYYLWATRAEAVKSVQRSRTHSQEQSE